MASPATTPKKVPVAPLVVSAIVAAVLIAGLVYLNKPPAKTPEQASASPEAKAYVTHLQLSDVTMKATQNFMNQQVVEIEGKIRNNGPSALQTVDVYCLFYGVDNREIYREKAPIVQSKGPPLKPSEVRSFRMPFDSLPDGWNQAMPKMVIAAITFVK